ncbi:hypothetical protein D3C74_56830 [compost metagenome]
MDEFLRGGGLLCTVLVVLYMAKRINAFMELVRMTRSSELGHYEDRIVYMAARAFEEHKSTGNIKEILLESCQFDVATAERVLSLAKSNIGNQHGRYEAFLRAVNEVLGEEIYYSTQS